MASANKFRHFCFASQVFHDLIPYPDSACTFIQAEVAEESREIFWQRGSLDYRSSWHPGPDSTRGDVIKGPGQSGYVFVHVFKLLSHCLEIFAESTVILPIQWPKYPIQQIKICPLSEPHKSRNSHSHWDSKTLRGHRASACTL